MNKSLSAAIAGMLMVTASAWAASPEGQAIRPMGDNQPDPTPTEQANQPDDPVPMDDEQLKGDYRKEQQNIERDVEQKSMKEYDNPAAAGDGADEDRD